MTSSGAPEATNLRAVYGPLPQTARVFGPISTTLIAFGLFLASILIAALVGGGVGAALGFALSSDPAAPVVWAGVGVAVAFFPSLAFVPIVWALVVERRSLASLGFSGGRAASGYVIGVGAGVGLALALAALAGVAAAAFGVSPSVEEQTFAIRKLANPGVILGLSLAALAMLIQGACEEIALRGWLLSALAARAGLVVALVLSSVVFGLMHGDRLMLDVGWGVASVIGTGAVGLAFGVWAVRRGSIYGVCGAHGGFNAALIVGTLASLIAMGGEGEAIGVLDALNQMLATLAEGDAREAVIGSLVQAGLFGSLAIALWRVLKS